MLRNICCGVLLYSILIVVRSNTWIANESSTFDEPDCFCRRVLGKSDLLCYDSCFYHSSTLLSAYLVKIPNICLPRQQNHVFKVYVAPNSRVCLVDRNGYYTRVMQDMLRQVENEVRWCNMKMDDRSQTINERLFRWHALGTVNYTNGFVVSIDKIDLTNIEQGVTTRTENDKDITTVTVRGRLNLRELNVGFDVIANLEDSGAHRFTGTFSHLLVVIQTSITKTLQSGDISTAATVFSLSSGTVRMIYRPASNITEMLSRSFSASSNWDSYSRWGREVFAPRMLQVANKIDFPSIRFDGLC